MLRWPQNETAGSGPQGSYRPSIRSAQGQTLAGMLAELLSSRSFFSSRISSAFGSFSNFSSAFSSSVGSHVGAFSSSFFNGFFNGHGVGSGVGCFFSSRRASDGGDGQTSNGDQSRKLLHGVFP